MTIAHDEKIFDVAEGRFDYRPSDEWIDTKAMRERFFEWALRAGNRVIYIDEFGDVCESAQVYPRKLKAAVTRGRWKNLGIWGTTQEPIRVPSFLFGQAQHRYVFYLGNDDHRKAAAKMMQQDALPWDVPGGLEERSYKFVLKTPGGIWGPMALDEELISR